MNIELVETKHEIEKTKSNARDFAVNGLLTKDKESEIIDACDFLITVINGDVRSLQLRDDLVKYTSDLVAMASMNSGHFDYLFGTEYCDNTLHWRSITGEQILTIYAMVIDECNCEIFPNNAASNSRSHLQIAKS